MASMRVPLLDVKTQFAAIREPLLQAVEATLASGQWILGPAVSDLEQKLSRYLSVPHAVGVASGTDALLVGLRALGCGGAGSEDGPGDPAGDNSRDDSRDDSRDEVIAPTYSFFATAGAIVNAGAKPVFVDIDERTYNMDPDGLEAALSPRTKAVMPVHLYGQSADMSPILEICGRRGIPVIEDAAQAIGATWGDTPVGGVGDLGCFSFYPSKNLGGVGDGGMITTRRDDLAARVRMLRVHGSRVKYHHEEVGFNSRLDSVQAAVLEVKLRYLDGWAQARADHARVYAEGLSGLEAIGLPVDAGHGRHVWNQYVLRVRRGSRDSLQAFLGENGIGSEIYYPIPLHLQPCFASLGYRPGDFPVSEAAARTTLAVPVYPEMTADQQGYVIESVRRWARAQ